MKMTLYRARFLNSFTTPQPLTPCRIEAYAIYSHPGYYISATQKVFRSVKFASHIELPVVK